MNDRLRVDDRGLAAGIAAALLAVAVYLTLVRFTDKWDAIVQFIIFGVAAAAALAYALREFDAGAGHAGAAPADAAGTGAGGAGARQGVGAYASMISTRAPAGWTSAALVAGFALTVGALVSLADVLGANTDDLHSSTITWISLVLVVLFGALAFRTGSAVCLLLATVSFVVMVVFAVDWIFSPDDPAKTYRWVLLFLGVGLFALGFAIREQRPRHGTVVVVVSGLSIIAMAFTFAQGLVTLGDPDAGGGGVGWGWELVILLFGLLLTAYAVWTREPGPGYVAAGVLLAFVTLAANSGDEPSLIGWPIVLVIVTGLAIAAALRPGTGSGGPGAPAATGAPPQEPGDATREVRL